MFTAQGEIIKPEGMVILVISYRTVKGKSQFVRTCWGKNRQENFLRMQINTLGHLGLYRKAIFII